MSDIFERRVALSTGVELDVWTAGDPTNPPIIFLHGFPESHRTWRHQMAALSDRYWCIAPDQRGYARSSKPAEISDYSIGNLVGDVIALADAMAIGSFTLAAHDWGGAIGWATALGHPARIERLIIANAPHPFIYQRTLIEDMAQREGAQYIRTFRDEAFIQAVEQNGAEWFFDTTFSGRLGLTFSPQEKAAYLEEWSQPGALRAMFNWYRASPVSVPSMDEDVGRPAFLDQSFPKLHMPVLIVWGMKDAALRPSQLDGIDDLVTDLTLVRIDDAGHFSPWEAPDAVNKAIGDWIV